MAAKTSRKDRFEMKLVKDLLKQKERYEEYFKTPPTTESKSPDHSALSAYTGLIKTTAELYRKIKSEGKAGEAELKEIAREILESDYGALRG